MYDAILFIVMVSLSSILLTPIFEMQTINQVIGDSYRENIAEETLHTFLVSMPLNFSYNMGGSLIDIAAETLGINTTDNNSLYHTITSWILGREQLHKTYSCIIAENLCSQYMIPISTNNSIRLNIFTEDFNRKLEYKIGEYFTDHLEGYNFNFTAYWYPIKGIPLGGIIQVGKPIPDTTCYHAEETFAIPVDITFNQLYNNSYIKNITSILDNHSINITKEHLSENLTLLFKGFLLDGFIENNTFYPSILDIFLSYGLSAIEDAIENISSKLINIAIGEGLYTLQDIIGDTSNITSYNGLFSVLEEEFIDYITSCTGRNFSTLNGIITPLKEIIKPVIWSLLQPIVEQLVSYIIEELSSSSSNPVKILMNLLFNQVSIKATAVLVVWRELV